MSSSAFFAAIVTVSLFTREWIEIIFVNISVTLHLPVSLFTREWIEITSEMFAVPPTSVSLFTREWIEISIFLFCCRCPVGLPLYEGVD